MNEFKELILGDVSIATYAAAFFFSFIVIFLNVIIVSLNKYKKAEGTPEKWSFSFAMIDNAKRMIATMMMMFLFYRFASTIIAKELSMEWAVGVGIGITFGLDKMMGWLKSKFNFFDTLPRTHEPTNENQQP